MTNQEIFATVLTNLARQGQASTVPASPEASDNTRQCAYRGDEGRKCSAGWLIADEHYHPNMEGSGPNSNLVADALVKSGVPDNEKAKNLVVSLQRVHDDFMPKGGGDEGMEAFYDAMKRVAVGFGLYFNAGEMT